VRHKVVVITWGDAFIDTDDFTQEDADATAPVMRSTAGFLVAKNQHGYVLATDEYGKDEDGVAARMFIKEMAPAPKRRSRKVNSSVTLEPTSGEEVVPPLA
jgi:hypothetical protein